MATGAMYVEKEDLFEKFLEDDEPASSADSIEVKVCAVRLIAVCARA